MSLEPINKKSIVNANEAIPDEELIHIITGIFQGLSDETRSESGISHQLSHLKELQLVKARRDGNVMYYSLSYTHLLGMLREAEEYADHIKQGIPDHPEAK
jgi:arginine repressor